MVPLELKPGAKKFEKSRISRIKDNASDSEKKVGDQNKICNWPRSVWLHKWARNKRSDSGDEYFELRKY